MDGSAKSIGGTYATLSVKNFGPIASGQVELRPLTVFTGYSNTGKSWFASLVYALFNSRVFMNRGIPEIEEIAGDSSIAFPKNPISWSKDIELGKSVKFTTSDKRIFKHALEGSYRKFRRDDILRCFGLFETKGLVRKGSGSGMNIEIQFPAGNLSKLKYKLSTGIQNNPEEWNCEVDLPDQINIDFNYFKFIPDYLDRIQLYLDDSASNSRASHNKVSMLRETLRAFRFMRQDNAWYLPADRGGIIHAHQVVVSALIQNAPTIGADQKSPIAALSGILADFLHSLVTLADERSIGHNSGTQDKRNIGASLARKIEESFVGGQVKVEETEVNYPRFSWTPHGWDSSLALTNASSMVTELVPLVLFLRHFVKKGDILILEEPEAHLHPKLQVEIVRLAAEWARAGIHVILTTHSEWVLYELSNVVGKSLLGPGKGLPQDDVGLWRFHTKNENAGSEIEEIEFDMDDGGYDTGFMDVAAEQHNIWANIAGEEE